MLFPFACLMHFSCSTTKNSCYIQQHGNIIQDFNAALQDFKYFLSIGRKAFSFDKSIARCWSVTLIPNFFVRYGVTYEFFPQNCEGLCEAYVWPGYVKRAWLWPGYMKLRWVWPRYVKLTECDQGTWSVREWPGYVKLRWVWPGYVKRSWVWPG